MRLLPKPHFADLIAGISVALVLIPQSIAYAALAGLPPAVGLTAAAVPPVVASVLGSSTYLQTGPVALTSLLTLGLLSGRADPGTGDFIALAALFAVMVGCIRLALGLTKAGNVAYLMSRPVILGFTSGAAVLIISSQLPAALGRGDLVDGHVIGRALLALSEFEDWNLTALVLAVMAGACVIGGRAIDRRIPGVLAAVIIGLALVGTDSVSVPVVGEIPSALPELSFALPWAEALPLLIPGLLMAIVDFAEPAAIARRFAEDEGEDWDGNRELVGQGAANVVAGFTGGYPVGGSFSRSSLNRLAGAKSRWSGVVAGAVVLCFLPFADVLADLPKSILAGVVIVAVSGLFQPLALAGLWRQARGNMVLAVATFGLTLATSPRIDRAVIVAIACQVALNLIRRLFGHAYVRAA